MTKKLAFTLCCDRMSSRRDVLGVGTPAGENAQQRRASRQQCQTCVTPVPTPMAQRAQRVCSHQAHPQCAGANVRCRRSIIKGESEGMGVAAAVDGAVRLAWPAVACARGARLVRVAVAIAAHCSCSPGQAHRHDHCQPHGYAVPCHAVRATGLERAHGRVTRGSTRGGRCGTPASQARGQRWSGGHGGR